MPVKYTLKKDSNSGDVLQKDGKDTFCPYQTAIPVPVQTSMGGVSLNMVRFPCSLNCPFAEVHECEDYSVYVTTCNGEKRFPLFESEEQKTSILRPM